MLESQLSGLPQTEKDKFFNVFEQNPDFFQKIAVEVQEEMKKGRDQMSATLEVVKKYENDLKKMI